MIARRPTILDVAREAGVSPTTVSHVLNDVPNARVKSATRTRVHEAAARLGYSPNKLARGLRRQQSQTLALLSDRIMTTPYAGRIVLGAQEKAAEHGWVLMLYSTGDDTQVEQREIQNLLEQQVDGVLYATMYHREVLVPRDLDLLPVVLVDCTTDKPQHYPSVVPDELDAGYQATNELIIHGHRTIGFVTNVDDVPATRGRLAGYRRALIDAGIEFREDLIASDLSETLGGYRTALQLLLKDPRPTAIFAYNDRMAMGVYRAAAELGLQIPHDLSVTSIDNQEILAEGLYPGLTTMALPHYEMGAWGVEQLVRLLNQPPNAPAEPARATLRCPIVRRQSVTAPRPLGSAVGA